MEVLPILGQIEKKLFLFAQEGSDLNKGAMEKMWLVSSSPFDE